MWLRKHETIYYWGQGVPLLTLVDHPTQENWNVTYNFRIKLYKNNYAMGE
jgi:hypothetical protein